MKKLLLIDDDPVFCKTFTDAIAGDAYTVVTAKDGEDGLAAFERERPDLIILDIQMPQLNGIDFLKELRLKHPGDRTPVIVASNVSALDTVSEGVALGIRGYIVKSEESLDMIAKTIDAAFADHS